MQIATWNVNSVRARLDNVLTWLRESAPDVLLLQEIKCETAAFPTMDFASLGYQAAVVGQKSYNGVAILSRRPIEAVIEKLPNDDSDTQARYIEATIDGVRIASLYLPNGNPLGGDKYAYKLAWMARLQAHMTRLLREEKPLVFGGDYNVIPNPEDVYDPQGWGEDALYYPPTRAAFRGLLHTGMVEAFRALHPHSREAFTFWDYQAASWPRGRGLRIDHFLLSPEAADRLVGCHIDPHPRGLDKASDHTPLVVKLR